MSVYTSSREQLEERSGNLLRTLHMSGKLKGHLLLTVAAAKVIEEPTLLHAVTKSLYVDLAKQFGTTRGNVERNIRNAISVAWKNGGKEELERMTGQSFEARPTNTEWLDWMVYLLRRGE